MRIIENGRNRRSRRKAIGCKRVSEKSLEARRQRLKYGIPESTYWLNLPMHGRYVTEEFTKYRNYEGPSKINLELAFREKDRKLPNGTNTVLQQLVATGRYKLFLTLCKQNFVFANRHVMYILQASALIRRLYLFITTKI